MREMADMQETAARAKSHLTGRVYCTYMRSGIQSTIGTNSSRQTLHEQQATQQQRLDSPVAAVTWQTSRYTVLKLYRRETYGCTRKISPGWRLT